MFNNTSLPSARSLRKREGSEHGREHQRAAEEAEGETAPAVKKLLVEIVQDRYLDGEKPVVEKEESQKDGALRIRKEKAKIRRPARKPAMMSQFLSRSRKRWETKKEKIMVVLVITPMSAISRSLASRAFLAMVSCRSRTPWLTPSKSEAARRSRGGY